MIAVTIAEELVTVLPLASLIVAVTIPKLPPETTVEGILLVVTWAAAPGVTAVAEVAPAKPGLLLVRV